MSKETALAACPHPDQDHCPNVHPNACHASLYVRPVTGPDSVLLLQLVPRAVLPCSGLSSSFSTSALRRAHHSCRLRTSALEVPGGNCAGLFHRSSKTLEKCLLLLLHTMCPCSLVARCPSHLLFALDFTMEILHFLFNVHFFFCALPCSSP